MSDGNTVVTDVKNIFSQIETDPTIYKFSKDDSINYPDGGHLQGIQKASCGDYLLSGSSDSMAYLLVIDGSTLKAIKIIDITPSGYSSYKHAGGFQITGDYCVVGIENDKDGGSVIALYLYDSNSKSLSYCTDLLTRTGDDDGSGTAGAVGVVKYNDGFILLVGSWDSDKVDIYSATGELETCNFEKIGTWDKDNADKSDWYDDNWGSYQSINLVQEESGDIYFFAFNRSWDRDFTDLYKLNTNEIFDENGTNIDKAFTKVSNKHMTCKDGASFRYSRGINIQNDSLITVLTSEKDLHEKTVLNIF